MCDGHVFYLAGVRRIRWRLPMENWRDWKINKSLFISGLFAPEPPSPRRSQSMNFLTLSIHWLVHFRVVFDWPFICWARPAAIARLNANLKSFMARALPQRLLELPLQLLHQCSCPLEFELQFLTTQGRRMLNLLCTGSYLDSTRLLHCQKL